MTNWIKRVFAAFWRWNTRPVMCSACNKNPAEVNDPYGGATCLDCYDNS